MHQKHPRLRGEDQFGSLSLTGGKETPPLTRGRLETHMIRDGAVGNTPAYAGKTSQVQIIKEASGKHPRLRGEDRGRWGPLQDPSETPPLTRGRPAENQFLESDFGNTPAYAGKTEASR